MIPSAGTPIEVIKLIKGIKGFLSEKESIKSFENALKTIVDVKFAFAINSGTSAIFIALESLKRIRPDRKKVVIPAYTAPIIKLPIERAGLEIVLCEVSRDTFNMDLTKLPELLSDDVLCVMPVHLFGIPTDIEPIKAMAKDKDIFILEDAAQSFGSKIDGKQTGSFGDIGILSFHRGKNLSTYSGGAILTNSESIANICERMVNALPCQGAISRFSNLIKLTIISQLVKPLVYDILNPLAAPFKSRDVHEAFDAFKYTGFQAKVGTQIFEHLEEYSRIRYNNGMRLLNGLKGVKGVTVPKIRDGMFPAFNQFPMVLDDADKMEKLFNALLSNGIEATRLYLKPMHKIFHLNYAKEPDPFPTASWLAQGLLLIPTHPYAASNDMDTAIETIKEIIK